MRDTSSQMTAPSGVEEEQKEEERGVVKVEEEEKEVEEEEVVEEEEKEVVEEEEVVEEGEKEVGKEQKQEVVKKEEKEVGKEEDVDSKYIFCGLLQFLRTAVKSKLKEKQTKTEEKTEVRRAAGETGSTDNTDKSSGWIKRMLSAFDGDSYQKQLELKKENFGKIQQSFSEVHRVRKLLKLGESVCKVIVTDVCEGTGFVLFDRLILTNAHLFRSCVGGNKLQEGTDVYALFNYDEPEPNTNYYTFTANKTLIDFDLELDYAILELNPKARKAKNLKVPQGLLSKFGPPPDNGEACLIGHPAGGLKKIDPTCIIEIEKRGQAVDKHLHPYKDKLFIVQSIIDVIQKQHIESIMKGGSKADKVVTYNTFMYHGASGSPVFDVKCRVFGLHTAGYCYGFPKETESVIEFALPLLSIFESFVGKLKKGGNKDLLERVQEEAKGNQYLEQLIEGLDAEEPMNTN